ncbi:MAG: hypothetical protein HFF36_09670 [Coprobacillus sp.]|nr:hypothetical protein [Coprobacillus sp.]
MKKETETLHQAINIYGKNAQLDMCIEEMSELTKEICKSKRGKDNKEEIIEEMADVYIMLEQLKIIFSVEQYEIDDIARVKLLRLKEILK